MFFASIIAVSTAPAPYSGHADKYTIERLAKLHPTLLTFDCLISPETLNDIFRVRKLATNCISPPSVASYLISQEQSCLYGKFTPRHDGHLSACPLAKGTMLGNVAEICMSDNSAPHRVTR